MRRRSALALLACSTAALAPAEAPHPALAAAPTPPLTKTFSSASDGFAFDYPDNWVVAFDRSGRGGTGAVVSIGDFTRYLVISVFRTAELPPDVRSRGLDVETGRALCLDPQAASESTMRFQQHRSEMAAPGQFSFEYEIESCRGEIQEGARGVMRCLSGTGQEIPSQKRHHLGAAIIGRSGLLTMTASSPGEAWADAEDGMRAIVSSLRAAL